MNFTELIETNGKIVNKKKGDHIFVQGSSNTSIYFIKSGLLKAYYITEEGKEFVKSFLLTNDVIGSLSSAYKGESCSFSLVCLEDSNLVEIPFSVIYSHCKTDHLIANSMIELLLNFSMKKEKREFEFLCMSAEDRYRKLEMDSPRILESVTQNDLARYLGVTPVGLSRIKKRVRL
ncbi:MAG: Crp/Fnr family transcriptional regulator [Xanthomonadales bacterium]|nr:Crp/Fnr family transcriptional regulator [Xanthomonadales bacterium]